MLISNTNKYLFPLALIIEHLNKNKKMKLSPAFLNNKLHITFSIKMCQTKSTQATIPSERLILKNECNFNIKIQMCSKKKTKCHHRFQLKNQGKNGCAFKLTVRIIATQVLVK